MALDLKFFKPDRTSCWGFRVVGGADFQEPLVAVKVHEKSFAEKAGLLVGDIITKINDTDTAILTHSEVHKLVQSAGSEFTLRIKRGELVSSHLLQDEGTEVEVRDVQVFVDEEIIDKAEELAEILGKEIFTEFGQHKAAVNKKSEKKMVFSNSTQTYVPTEEKYEPKKFSTFLMKPDRPQLVPKKTVEQRKIECDPYRIVIKKQSRRKPLPKEKRVQFDQNIIEVELESVSSRNWDSPEIQFSPDPDNSGYEHDQDSLEDDNHPNDDDYENDYDAGENEDFHRYGSEENQEYDENANETDFDCQIRKGSLEIKYKPISEILIDDPSSENVMTLEEQLRVVQKQLEALSQLPSDVQTTLDAVSKQLASIVSAKEEDEEDNDENGEFKEDASISIEARADVNEEVGDDDSIVGDELEEDSLVEEELQAIMQRAKLEDEEDDEEETENLETANKINEEELEERRKEEELLIKKEKEMTTQQKPNFRPIVLPGGRKWIDPDDVVPTRKPKMTDERIMESLDSSLEVIAGKRKGINFMKNAPPPKNLDHLQRSETYRLIHGMEPPTRGITTRPEKILPEQDYYQATRGSP